MTNAPDRPVVRLLPKRETRLNHGHPWVYSNEIAMDAAAKALPPGSIVTLATADGRPLAGAYFNPHPLIAARVLTRDASVAINRNFFAKRFAKALALRDRLYDAPYYRLIHAEADGLPAVIVDRMDDVLVVQLNAAGSNAVADDLIGGLADTLKPRAIILKNDSPVRALEGLTAETKLAFGALDGPVTLIENGAKFRIDPLEGQKTGWFYDQRDNRAFVAGLASGVRVLDVYSYGGGFGIACAVAGAESVLMVDRSAQALSSAMESAALNGVEAKCATRQEEAFEALAALAEAREKFGVVIVDPPAFAKSRKDVPAALHAYRKLVRLAARLVAPVGILFAASCSYNITLEAFAEAVAQGLDDASRPGRILRSAGAGPDHPVHPLLPESAYLKSMTLALD